MSGQKNTAVCCSRWSKFGIKYSVSKEHYKYMFISVLFVDTAN